jgi:hypothetical protein
MFYLMRMQITPDCRMFFVDYEWFEAVKEEFGN